MFTRSGGDLDAAGREADRQRRDRRRPVRHGVALSADGNTALIGGHGDNGSVGAAWVFTRSGATWTQQGAKLTGSGETGAGQFGVGVALSADGNTALIGGSGDNHQRRGGVGVHPLGRHLDAAGREADRQRRERRPGRFGVERGAVGGREHRPDRRPRATTASVGAAWVFTRSGGTWTQQGAKLTGSGETGSGQFGASVALSADGNTALIGGPDNRRARRRLGAAWVFTRSGATWTQQGAEADGSGAGPDRQFGCERGAVGRREHRPDRRPGRRQPHRGGVGVHPLGRHLDAAGREADRQRRDRSGDDARFGCSVALSADGEHRPDRRPRGQRRTRGGVGVHAAPPGRRSTGRTAARHHARDAQPRRLRREPEPGRRRRRAWRRRGRRPLRSTGPTATARSGGRTSTARAPTRASSPAPRPTGVAVDAQHVYWANSGNGTIGRANLDGTGVDQSFITGANCPAGVAVDGQYLYWANGGNGTIGRAQPQRHGRQPELHHRRLGADRRRRRRRSTSTGRTAAAARSGARTSTARASNQSFITGATGPRGVAVDGAARLLGEQRHRHDRVGDPRRHGCDQSFVAARDAPWGVAAVLSVPGLRRACPRAGERARRR